MFCSNEVPTSRVWVFHRPKGFDELADHPTAFHPQSMHITSDPNNPHSNLRSKHSLTMIPSPLQESIPHHTSPKRSSHPTPLNPLQHLEHLLRRPLRIIISPHIRQRHFEPDRLAVRRRPVVLHVPACEQDHDYQARRGGVDGDLRQGGGGDGEGEGG
jgi:hypothetical protein